MPPLEDINSDVTRWITEASEQSKADEQVLKNEVLDKIVAAKELLKEDGDEDVDKWTIFPSGIKVPPRPVFREPGPKESKLLYNSYVKVESANLEIWYIEYYNIIHTIDEGLALITEDIPAEKKEALVTKFDTLIEKLTPTEADLENPLPPGQLSGGRWREDEDYQQEPDSILSAAWAKQTKPSGLSRTREDEEDYINTPYTAPKNPIFHKVNNHVPGLMTENLPGKDGGSKYDIDIAKLKVFKELPEGIIKYMTPEAKHKLLEMALEEQDIQNVRATWTKPLAMIIDEDGTEVSRLSSSQHAWAFPEFVERGGAMQDEETFQCWACENARTYRECREKGYVETCTKKQNSCFVETIKEKVPRVSFPDYDYHKGRKGDVVRVEINMGCKQPEACYANKKQNFLVRSGRQCFPKTSMSSTLANGIDSVCRQCCHTNSCNKDLDPASEELWSIDHPGSDEYTYIYYDPSI